MKTDNIKILISAEDIQNRIAELAETLNTVYNGEELYVIGVLKGGVMFTVDLIKHLNMPVKLEFVRLSSYGSAKVSSGKVNSANINLPDLTNKNVLIAEDIIDTGYTAKFVMDLINQNYHVKTLKFAALLDKKARRKVDINADYHCFDVEDKFLVGFGLDYDEQYRNFPYIGYIE